MLLPISPITLILLELTLMILLSFRVVTWMLLHLLIEEHLKSVLLLEQLLLEVLILLSSLFWMNPKAMLMFLRHLTQPVLRKPLVLLPIFVSLTLVDSIPNCLLLRQSGLQDRLSVLRSTNLERNMQSVHTLVFLSREMVKVV